MHMHACWSPYILYLMLHLKGRDPINGCIRPDPSNPSYIVSGSGSGPLGVLKGALFGG